MPNANQSLRDRVVRHELYLKKLANEEVRAVRELVTQAEADIQQQIERRLTWIAERGFDSSPFTLRRLEANLREVRAVARAAYREIGGKLKQDLTAVAKSEAEWAAGAVGAELSRVGVELGVGVAEGSLLSAIVTKQPFQGALLKDWAAKLGEDTFHAVRGAVRQGLLQGESIADITRRLRGTKANGFKDGILAIRRRNADAVVRTAVSSVANSAREATWKANDDLVKGVQWVSTLDDRTTPQCQVRDGLEYTLDYEPRGHSVPWGDGPGALHWNCRSTSVPVLATWKELGIDAREVTDEQRAALDGMVPSTQTFGEWLGHMRDQGRLGLVEEVLGKRRAAAFMAGQIRFRDLFNESGDFLTLEQLQLADPGRVATQALIQGGAPLAKLAEQVKAARPLPKTMAEFERMLDESVHEVNFSISNPNRSMSDVEYWNTVVGVRPDDYLDAISGGKRIVGDIELSSSRGGERTVGVYGELTSRTRSANGQFDALGSIERRVNGDNAHHGLLRLDKARRGAGIAKDVLRESFRLYREIGVKTVDLTANIDVGGYAWAKYGFVPLDYEWNILSGKLLREFRDAVSSASKRTILTGRAPAYAALTPREIAAVEKLLQSDDPRSIWALSDFVAKSGVKVGKELLLGSYWDGILALDDPMAVRRFEEYISRGAT